MKDQAIYKFLFEVDMISGVFLSLMLLLFLVGLIFSRRKLKQFSENLELVQGQYQKNVHGIAQKLSPTEFIKLNIDEQYTTGFVEAIPGALVSLGILGTFIGLGMAIGGASENMADQFTSIEKMKEVQNSLSELLNAVSFKFRVSAWGIMLSILFNFLVLRRFEEDLEGCMESAARNLLPSYQSVGDTIVHTARIEREEFQRTIQETLSKAIDSMSETMTEQLKNNQVQTNTTMNVLSQTLDRSFKEQMRINQINQKQTQNFIENLSNHLAQALNKQTDINQKSLNMYEELNSKIQELGQKIDSIKGMTIIVEKAASDFKTLAENTEKKMAAVQKIHQSTHESFEKQYDKTLSEFEKHMVEIQSLIVNEQANHNTQFENNLATAKNQMNQMSQALQEFYKVHSTSLTSNLEKMLLNQKGVIESTQTVLHTFDDSIQKVQQNHIVALSKQIQDFNEVLSTLKDDFSQSLSTHQSFTMGQVETVSEKFKETQQHTQESQNASIQLQEELNASVLHNQSIHQQLTISLEQSNRQIVQLQEVFVRFEKLFAEKTIQIGLYDEDMALLFDVETAQSDTDKYPL